MSERLQEKRRDEAAANAPQWLPVAEPASTAAPPSAPAPVPAAPEPAPEPATESAPVPTLVEQARAEVTVPEPPPLSEAPPEQSEEEPVPAAEEVPDEEPIDPVATPKAPPRARSAPRKPRAKPPKKKAHKPAKRAVHKHRAPKRAKKAAPRHAPRATRKPQEKPLIEVSAQVALPSNVKNSRQAFVVLSWFEYLLNRIPARELPYLIDTYRTIGWIDDGLHGWFIQMAHGVGGRRTKAGQTAFASEGARRLVLVHKETLRFLRQLRAAAAQPEAKPEAKPLHKAVVHKRH